MSEGWRWSLARCLVLAMVVMLPLTAVLLFAAADVLVPHPWSKHSHGASHAGVKLPAGIAATATAPVALPLLGPLATSVSPVAASIALRPPFVPPRA